MKILQHIPLLGFSPRSRFRGLFFLAILNMVGAQSTALSTDVDSCERRTSLIGPWVYASDLSCDDLRATKAVDRRYRFPVPAETAEALAKDYVAHFHHGMLTTWTYDGFEYAAHEFDDRPRAYFVEKFLSPETHGGPYVYRPATTSVLVSFCGKVGKLHPLKQRGRVKSWQNPEK